MLSAIICQVIKGEKMAKYLFTTLSGGTVAHNYEEAKKLYDENSEKYKGVFLIKENSVGGINVKGGMFDPRTNRLREVAKRVARGEETSGWLKEEFGLIDLRYGLHISEKAKVLSFSSFILDSNKPVEELKETAERAKEILDYCLSIGYKEDEIMPLPLNGEKNVSIRETPTVWGSPIEMHRVPPDRDGLTEEEQQLLGLNPEMEETENETTIKKSL